MWFVVGFTAALLAAAVARKALTAFLPEWLGEATVASLAIAFIAWQGLAPYDGMDNTISEGAIFGALWAGAMAISNLLAMEAAEFVEDRRFERRFNALFKKSRDKEQ